jgi:outer membrane murein-binding lipoprotein Lpp
MKCVVVAVIFCLSMIAGCARTPRVTTQEEVAKSRQREIERLERRIEMLNKDVTNCEAELARNGKYVVRPGDTLSTIAKQNGIDWHELAKMNPEIMKGYPGSWNVGIVVRIRDENPSQPPQRESR